MPDKTLTRASLEVDLGRFLRDNGLTLSIAESCTGGLVAHVVTNVPGSSDYFDRGIISYSNAAKREILDVREHSLMEYGAVSEEVALEMARGVKENSGTDIGLSTTGIAGPGGGTKEKPVGLVYVGLVSAGDDHVKRMNFDGDRITNKRLSAEKALEFLLEKLSSP
jgi:nicotinamide-nucleotide amidase